MSRKPSISNPQGEVDRHIGTSYDIVKIVSDNMDALLEIADFLNGGGGGDPESDHLLLDNIGTNSHDQIDIHLADSDLHFKLTQSVTEPVAPVSGELWLNTSTQELSIRANGIWEAITYKTELANLTGDLLITAGNF